jgi:hypothetical protein
MLPGEYEIKIDESVEPVIGFMHLKQYSFRSETRFKKGTRQPCTVWNSEICERTYTQGEQHVLGTEEQRTCQIIHRPK